tara:strand:- start:487 stop:684 length:198 start_codon:yes stop_codon:yes gene_type:complete
MTNNIKIILIIIFGIIALYVFKLNSDYNLKKTILACMTAQKKTTQSYDIEKARKFCSEEIKKGIK